MSQKRPLLTTNNRLTTHSKNLPQTDTVKRLKALLDDTANGNDRKTRPKKRRVDAPSNTVRPDKLPRSAMEEANVNACSSTSATQDNRSRTSATAPISQRWSCLSRKLKPQTPGVNKVDVWGGQPATSTSVTNNKQVPLFSVRKPPVKPVCVHSKVNDAVSVCLHVKHDNQSVTRAVMDPPVLSASRKATDSIAAAVPILRRKLGLQVIRTKQRTVIGRMNSEKSYSVPLMEGPLTIEKAAASIVDKTATNSSSSTFHAAASPAINPLDAVGTERTKSASGDLEHDGINNKEDPKDDELVLDDPAHLKGPHTTTFSKPDDPSIRSTPLDSRATSSLAASQPMPRPTRDGLTTTTLKSKQQKGDQGNFVRLNLRNGAGSCRGALPKKTKSKAALQWEQRRKNRDEFYASNRGEHDDTQTTQSYATKPRHDASTMTQHSSGTDPLDDYIDGIYDPQHQKVAADHRRQEASNGPAIPNCSHGRPCKRLTVKKASVNKGRVFFACSLPRAEQCDCFIWADDTVQAAQQALLRNQSCSGFVARQVASYMESMKIMTVPELQRLAARKGLNSTGKKQALLARLSIWVRDEVAVSVAEEQSNEKASVPVDPTELEKATGVYAESGNLESETTLPDKPDVVVEADFSTKCVNEAAQRVPRDMLLKDSLNLKNSESGCVMPLLERRQGLRLPEIVDDEVSLDESSDDEMELCEPTLQLQNSSSNSCPLHLALKAMFGHDSFRESQEWTVRRCLDKKRTLLVAPTGFGKSLCYALPASLMKGVCIVVSPLISLIQDQLRVLPPRLPAATMSGAVTSAKLAATLDDIIRGRIRILFVSPERLTSASFRRLFRPIWNTDRREHERKFPPVSLLCVDEAHCLSQWAHNFRPSYLRLKSMVNMIQPESVLAITATAGPKVVTDICRTLNIDKNTSEEADNGVRVMKCNRDNIDVRCLLLTSQTERLKKVIKILTPKKKGTSNKSVAPEVSDDGCLATGNVIVYVWRQLDAQAVAENLQAAGIEGGIVIYHGGMDASARSKAQSKFMRGKARICVATVAFGLGINKEDVTGVIHMYLSASPEHYMQEIGRAGRDGRSAVAFALVLEDEILVRHSLAHSDLIAKSQVKALLSSLIGEVEDGKRLLPADRSTADPISVGLPLHKAVVECGAKSETVETLVSLLEQRTSGVPLLQIEGVFYDCAFVAPKRRSMKDLAVKESIAGAILRVATCTEPPAGEAVDLSIEREKAFPGCRKMVGYSYGSYAFSVAKCANLLGSSAEPRHVFAALRRLESNGEIELALDKSINSQALNIRLTHEGMMTFRSDNCIGVNEIVSELFSRFIATVELSTTKVLDMHYIFQKVGAVSQVGSTHFLGENEKKSRSLVLFQELTRNYLEAEGLGQSLNDRSDDQSSFTQSIHKAKLWSDVRAVLGSLHDMLAASSRRPLVEINDPHAADYAALSTTKFLHGIAPATLAPRLLRTHPLFGSMQAVRFTVLHEAVSDIAAPQTKGDSGS